MRKEELRTYIENHESEMIEDLKKPDPDSKRKTGRQSQANHSAAPAAEALAQGIEILENTALP